MKILITGAAGFIGTHLVKYCIEQGHQVMAIDNNWPRKHELIPILFGPGHDRVEMNVAIQPITMENECFEKWKPDVCYHLAAYASEGRSNHIRSFIHSNNTVGTANVINACVNHKCKLVFTSSVAVYSGEAPFNESIIPKPIDSYGVSKYCSEMDIMIAARTQQLEYCIIRPRNVMGPGQNIFDRSRNLFGIWCYNVLNNLPLIIFGDGTQRRCFTYIDDIIPSLYIAKNVRNEIINLGSAESYSINEAAMLFCEVTGYSKSNIQYTEVRHEVIEATCDIEKSVKLLGFESDKIVLHADGGTMITIPKSKTALKDAIAKMWAWARTVPMRSLDVPPPLECHINAHSSLK